MSTAATIEDLRQEIEFRDKIIRKLELRVLDKDEQIQQLLSDLDKVLSSHLYFQFPILIFHCF